MSDFLSKLIITLWLGWLELCSIRFDIFSMDWSTVKPIMYEVEFIFFMSKIIAMKFISVSDIIAAVFCLLW